MTGQELGVRRRSVEGLDVAEAMAVVPAGREALLSLESAWQVLRALKKKALEKVTFNQNFRSVEGSSFHGTQQ